MIFFLQIENKAKQKPSNSANDISRGWQYPLFPIMKNYLYNFFKNLKFKFNKNIIIFYLSKNIENLI